MVAHPYLYISIKKDYKENLIRITTANNENCKKKINGQIHYGDENMDGN